MTQNELNAYRRSLMNLRHQVGGQIDDVRGTGIVTGEADSGLPDTLIDTADQSVHEYEEQVDRSLAESEVKILSEVDEALGRIDAGTFGRCGVCNRPIARERLRAIPYARDCIDCAGGKTVS